MGNLLNVGCDYMRIDFWEDELGREVAHYNEVEQLCNRQADKLEEALKIIESMRRTKKLDKLFDLVEEVKFNLG